VALKSYRTTAPIPVVSDTSPILNLAIINQLDLLQQQFAEVLIPPAVLAELMPETKFPGRGHPAGIKNRLAAGCGTEGYSFEARAKV
jgi:hypothetical protein